MFSLPHNIAEELSEADDLVVEAGHLPADVGLRDEAFGEELVEERPELESAGLRLEINPPHHKMMISPTDSCSQQRRRRNILAVEFV